LGIGLPNDDEFDDLVHPDGSFQVMVVDLTELRKLKEKEHFDFHRQKKEMFRLIDDIRENLKKISARSLWFL